MKIYKVSWVQKDGGYSPGDSCVSGGYYDKNGYEIITASSAEKARQAVKTLHPTYLVRRPLVLGDA